MPQKRLWVGIPLLALALAGGAYVVRAERASVPKTSTGDTQLTADVMDTAKLSCCAAQEASTKLTTANATGAKCSESSPTVAGAAHVESGPTGKASCDRIGAGADAGSPDKASHTTGAKLVKQESVGDQGACPISGAKMAKAKTAGSESSKATAKSSTQAATVAGLKVAAAAK